MAEIFMTAEGKAQLEKKLHELKVIGRDEVARKISEARDHGDLSENAEYDIAKEEQAKLEAEIADLEEKLRNAKVFVEKTKGDTVDLGSKIKIVNVATKEEYDYTMVGEYESNPFEKRLSNDSPLGKALMGKKQGDEVLVNRTGGIDKYKIVKL